MVFERWICLLTLFRSVFPFYIPWKQDITQRLIGFYKSFGIQKFHYVVSSIKYTRIYRSYAFLPTHTPHPPHPPHSLPYHLKNKSKNKKPEWSPVFNPFVSFKLLTNQAPQCWCQTISVIAFPDIVSSSKHIKACIRYFLSNFYSFTKW